MTDDRKMTVHHDTEVDPYASIELMVGNRFVASLWLDDAPNHEYNREQGKYARDLANFYNAHQGNQQEICSDCDCTNASHAETLHAIAKMMGYGSVFDGTEILRKMKEIRDTLDNAKALLVSIHDGDGLYDFDAYDAVIEAIDLSLQAQNRTNP